MESCQSDGGDLQLESAIWRIDSGESLTLAFTKQSSDCSLALMSSAASCNDRWILSSSSGHRRPLLPRYLRGDGDDMLVLQRSMKTRFFVIEAVIMEGERNWKRTSPSSAASRRVRVFRHRSGGLELPCDPSHLPSMHDMGSFISRPVLIFRTILNRATNGFVTAVSRVILGCGWQT